MIGAGATRWAFVTGASRGIGRATALALAQAGWNVGIHFCTSQSAAHDLVNQITSTGRESFAVCADLQDPQASEMLVESAFREAVSIECWAHVAGADVLTGDAANFTFEKKLHRTIAVDLIGTILTCRAVGRRMADQGKGSIVTIGWDQADTGMEGDSGEMFAAVKGGVSAFTRSLGKSLAPNVRVNCVAPGWIRTQWGLGASQKWQDRVQSETPLKRWGTPDDVANAIVFLASDSANFLTGQTICVNGGVVMK